MKRSELLNNITRIHAYAVQICVSFEVGERKAVTEDDHRRVISAMQIQHICEEILEELRGLGFDD